MKPLAACISLLGFPTLCWLAFALSPQAGTPVQFKDVISESGITFKHDNAATPQRYLIETMGSGAAWIDYDNDGYLDLFLANSAATTAYKPIHPLRSALYHSNGDGTFTDVTEKAGFICNGYSRGRLR